MDDMNPNKNELGMKRELDEMIIFHYSEPTYPIPKEYITVEF